MQYDRLDQLPAPRRGEPVSLTVCAAENRVITSIPIGTRIASGFLQSAAVRSAGFGIVPLAYLAPAVK